MTSQAPFSFIEIKNEQSEDGRTMCCVQGCFTIFDSPEEEESHMTEVHEAKTKAPSLFYKERPVCPLCKKTLRRRTLEQHRKFCKAKNLDPEDSSDIEYVEVKMKRIIHFPLQQSKTIKCISCQLRVGIMTFMEHFKDCSRGGSSVVKKEPNRGLKFTKCDKCGRSIEQFRMRRHQALHDQRKEQCDNCDKIVLSENMTDHKKKCTYRGEKKYPCQYQDCPRSFASIQGRNVHMFAAHNRS